MSLVHNERTKLLANALDRASTACVAIGLIAPIVTVGLGADWESLTSVVIWLLSAILLHLVARMVLGRLKP